MNIVVCVKRVPDTETRIRVAADGKRVETDGVKYVLNPYDEFAVEAALQTTEALGGGEVTLLSFGDAGVKETLRGGLAMGAHRAVHLPGDATLDGLRTAGVLAAALEGIDAPLVLFGIKAVDGDQQQVGLMVAELLDRPAASAVTRFSVDGSEVTCHRAVEGGSETVEMDLPAVITVTKGNYEPRYASLKGIMAAKKKPLDEGSVPDARGKVALDSLELPPARPEGRVVGEGAAAAAELARLLREEAKVL